MLQNLRELEPSFESIEEAAVQDPSGKTVGWMSHFRGKNGETLAGGAHPIRDMARQIGFSETCERALFLRLKNGIQNSNYHLVEYPTSCGFAFGFEPEKVKLRAIAEALERWAWSQWIDQSKYLPELNVQTRDGDFYRVLASPFQGIRRFQKNFRLGEHEFVFRVFLGFTDHGVFPGSRVSLAQDNSWGHAILESWRHWQINEQSQISNWLKTQTFYNRIKYFGQNKNYANQIISRSKDKKWSQPRLALLKEVQTCTTFQSSCFRALMVDFMSWHLGPESRFVY